MMRREDWLWLLTKAMGLWLVAVGVEYLGNAAGDFGSRRLMGQSNVDPWLPVLIPLAAGGCLLFTDCTRWFVNGVPAGAAEGAVSTSGGGGAIDRMTRQDWLWVGLRLVGAYGLVMSAATLVYLIDASDWSDDASLWTRTTWIVPMLLSLWLLFGDRIFRLASRGPRRSPKSLPPPASS